MPDNLPIIIDRDSPEPLQKQLRRGFIAAIHDGRLKPGQKVLASRGLALQLGLARNTVTAVYDELIARGYLETLPRRGCFVAVQKATLPVRDAAPATLDWQSRLQKRPSQLNHIIKTPDWPSYRYPFIFGEVDRNLFPFAAWRSSSRDTLGRATLDWWSADQAVEDDPMLVEQIRTRILPERGIYARPDEVLITLGTQQGFFLLDQVLSASGKRVGCEMPGYPDARYIFETSGATTVPLAVDAQGAVIPPGAALDLAILTPGAHCPTMTLMSDARRQEVLAAAARDDFLIIEDDHDGLTTFSGKPALKSQDSHGRVLYLGSLSKVLAPGVRLGFMIAPAPVIEEARWMRRLIHRFMPLNNQRMAAVFLAEGHFLSLTRSLRAAHSARWFEVVAHLDTLMPGFRAPDPCHGGASVWLECPDGFDARALRSAAQDAGLLFEDGDPFVPSEQAGRYFRLGLSVIDQKKIKPGMALLGQLADRQRNG